MSYGALLLTVVVGLGLPGLAMSQTFTPAPVPEVVETRPKYLVPLYVALAGAQVLDIHSSRLAISRGGHEMNAVVRDALTNHRWTSIAIKSAVTAGLFTGAERLWRRKHGRGAVFLTAIVTAVQLGVDVHNYRVAAQLR